MRKMHFCCHCSSAKYRKLLLLLRVKKTRHKTYNFATDLVWKIHKRKFKKPLTNEVSVKNIFCDVTPYSLAQVNPRFGGTFRFELQVRANF
jgi:hypothetical protein